VILWVVVGSGGIASRGPLRLPLVRLKIVAILRRRGREDIGRVLIIVLLM
jgi:hypothetical protein